MKLKLGVHWFRQDLRIDDNPSLEALAKKVDKIIPIYIFDPKQRIGSVSRWWLEQSLKSLSNRIEKKNGKLNIFLGDPYEIISSLIFDKNIEVFSWNRLYDSYSINRDKKIKLSLKSSSINCETFNGYLLNEPWDIKNKSGTFFKVFTPYWRYCNELINNKNINKKNHNFNFFNIKLKNSKNLQDLKLTNTKLTWTDKIHYNWLPGENNAKDQLKEFINNKANNYSVGRDRPDQNLTSKLSPHLHFGEISPIEIYNQINLSKKINRENKEKFLAEIGWRDFSYNLLYYYPDMTNNPIQKKFNKFPWLKDNRNLKKWQKGFTGIPIVDAGMRQLYETGWMHNRVRMIVGSFLTKNLLLHWKHGEEWFFDTLVDADIGSNSAGWQWISGCGADASPYFRIFNPILQGQKFDPKGEYVKKYIPELQNVKSKFIHNPWEMSEENQNNSGCKIGKDYPAPIVDLKDTRNRALIAFKKIS
ncbi:DNA photolyase family protein [Pelagibacteraceae bacterium]|nr:DNA photolyase family protein [Pelagibacteraceae bacterium]